MSCDTKGNTSIAIDAVKLSSQRSREIVPEINDSGSMSSVVGFVGSLVGSVGSLVGSVGSGVRSVGSVRCSVGSVVGSAG